VCGGKAGPHAALHPTSHSNESSCLAKLKLGINVIQTRNKYVCLPQSTSSLEGGLPSSSFSRVSREPHTEGLNSQTGWLVFVLLFAFTVSTSVCTATFDKYGRGP
jgi:hypothetical protein